MSCTYDLYVYERGRWMLEATFGADRRADALKLARRIDDHRSAEGIQVIREKLDATSQRVERSTVFNTWRRRSVREWRETRGDGPGPYAEIFPEHRPPDLTPRPMPVPAFADAATGAPVGHSGPVIAKLLAIAVASFGLATLAAVVHAGAGVGAIGL